MTSEGASAQADGVHLDVSVVVPFYNPGERLRPVVESLSAGLAAAGRSFELLAVSDGSTDDAATDLEARPVPGLRLVVLARNEGKGETLRVGMGQARGRLVGFIDGDGDIDPATMVAFVDRALAEDPDAVLGSKNHPASQVHVTTVRRVASLGWQCLVRLCFQLPVSDSQAGAKLFRANVVRDVLPRTTLRGFAFDLEFLVVAHDLGYHRMVEAPVTLAGRQATTVSIGSALRMLSDVGAIFWRLRVRRRLRRGP